MSKQKKGIIIVVILIALVIIVSVFLNNKINVHKEDNQNSSKFNNHLYNVITFDQFAKSDCIEINNKDYKEKCELSLGSLIIDDNTNSSINVIRNKDLKDKYHYEIYIENNLIDIDDSYNIYSLEVIKTKDSDLNNKYLFLVTKNDKDYKTYLIDREGKVLKELTSDYNNYNYEIEVLNDEKTYLFYNTCSNNKLERHRLNLIDLSKDKVIYNTKVLTCK